MLFSRVKISCFAQKYTWYFVGVYNGVLGPLHIYPFLFENEYFSAAWPTWRPHVSRENGHQKRIFFSPEWRFLKTPASHLRVDGLKKRLSASMM